MGRKVWKDFVCRVLHTFSATSTSSAVDERKMLQCSFLISVLISLMEARASGLVGGARWEISTTVTKIDKIVLLICYLYKPLS